jgi:hypothetical protein
MTLLDFCAESLARKVPSEIMALAAKVRARHEGVVAVLAYGSCLRGVDSRETLIDYYVLTDTMNGVSANPMSRWGCQLAPPNVYYIEDGSSGGALRAKYAVLPLVLFETWVQRGVLNPYFWARFAQPSALLHASDSEMQRRVTQAMAHAHETFYANAIAIEPDGQKAWTAGFRATYASELRPEPRGKADEIVEMNADYYARATQLMRHVAPFHANQSLRRITGKMWSLARLAKASFTFRGGADYLAWKIERHSGEKIVISPWQRRHPIIASLLLLPALRRKGAVR